MQAGPPMHLPLGCHPPAPHVPRLTPGECGPRIRSWPRSGRLRVRAVAPPAEGSRSLTLQGQPHGPPNRHGFPQPDVGPQLRGCVEHGRGIFDADRGGTFEDHHGFRPVEVGPSVLTDLDQSGVSFFITEPDNLEGELAATSPPASL